MLKHILEEEIMHLGYEIDSDYLAIKLLETDNQGDIEICSVRIPLNELYDKMIDKHNKCACSPIGRDA